MGDYSIHKVEKIEVGPVVLLETSGTYVLNIHILSGYNKEHAPREVICLFSKDKELLESFEGDRLK